MRASTNSYAGHSNRNSQIMTLTIDMGIVSYVLCHILVVHRQNSKGNDATQSGRLYSLVSRLQCADTSQLTMSHCSRVTDPRTPRARGPAQPSRGVNRGPRVLDTRAQRTTHQTELSRLDTRSGTIGYLLGSHLVDSHFAQRTRDRRSAARSTDHVHALRLSPQISVCYFLALVS